MVTKLRRKVRRHVLQFDARTIFLLVAVVLVAPLLLFAAQNQAIAIKDSSVNKNVVLVNGEVNGKPVQLECFLSVADCKIPKEGGYLLVRLPRGEGPYMDCPNVHLYEKSTPSQQGQRVGEYCLLGE